MGIAILATSMPLYAAPKVATEYKRADFGQGQEYEDSHYLYLDQDEYELKAGEEAQLALDTDIPISELAYESSDPSAVTVSPLGKLTAISAGAEGRKTVTVTVTWQGPKDEGGEAQVYEASCQVSVENTITVSETECEMYVGQKTAYSLTAKTNPAGAVSWSSSDPGVATVDAQGRITPKKAGTARITATANGVSASCIVTVKKPTLTLPAKATVYLKNPATLDATVIPGTKIKWKSSNKKIATVNAKGVITGKKTGTVKITATAHGIKKTCKVTVEKPSLSIQKDYYYGNTQTYLYKGGVVRLNTDSHPGDARIKWSSSNTKVAKVDAEGVVTARKTGKAKITASIPGAKDTIEIKVIEGGNYELNFTKKTMMVGNQAYLCVKNLMASQYPSFFAIEGSNAVSLQPSSNGCNVTAIERGDALVNVRVSVYQDGKMVLWGKSCKIQVINTGISEQQFSLAKGAEKTLEIKVPDDSAQVRSVSWSSTAPEVASVGQDSGIVRGCKVGSAKINAKVTYESGAQKTYSTSMMVSNPKMKSSTVVVALYGRNDIPFRGLNAYSKIQWKGKQSSIVSVGADGRLYANKKGKASIAVEVDGKPFKCKVYVSNPRLKFTYCALPVDGENTLRVKGLTSKSKVTYKSTNKKVATVSKSGKIKAKQGGRSTIHVCADGMEFDYLVEVASQAALNACAEGKAIIKRSTYSQPMRMTEGYYDCSSLVFRAYGRNSALLGGMPSWAPTAANMAQYMANTGKVIAWKGVSVEELRPGDLLFYGKDNNGRYQGIYHVSMYYGNGLRLEKPMYEYNPAGNIVMVARPVP